MRLAPPHRLVDRRRPLHRVGGGVVDRPAVELADDEKEPILRAYLRRWRWEVGQFFQGVGPDSPAEDLERIAPHHPVFRISA